MHGVEEVKSKSERVIERRRELNYYREPLHPTLPRDVAKVVRQHQSKNTAIPH